MKNSNQTSTSCNENNKYNYEYTLTIFNLIYFFLQPIEVKFGLCIFLEQYISCKSILSIFFYFLGDMQENEMKSISHMIYY